MLAGIEVISAKSRFQETLLPRNSRIKTRDSRDDSVRHPTHPSALVVCRHGYGNKIIREGVYGGRYNPSHLFSPRLAKEPKGKGTILGLPPQAVA